MRGLNIGNQAVSSTKDNIVEGVLTEDQQKQLDTYSSIIKDPIKVANFKNQLLGKTKNIGGEVVQPNNLALNAPKTTEPTEPETPTFVSEVSEDRMSDINTGLDSLLNVVDGDYRNIDASHPNPLAHVPSKVEIQSIVPRNPLNDRITSGEVKTYDRPKDVIINEDNIKPWLAGEKKWEDEYFDNYIKDNLWKEANQKKLDNPEEYTLPTPDQITEASNEIREGWKQKISNYRRQIEGRELQTADLQQRIQGAENIYRDVSASIVSHQMDKGASFTDAWRPMQIDKFTGRDIAYANQREDAIEWVMQNDLVGTPELLNVAKLQQELFALNPNSPEYAGKKRQLDEARLELDFGSYMYDRKHGKEKILREGYTEDEAKKNTKEQEDEYRTLQDIYDLTNPVDATSLQNLFIQETLKRQKYVKQRNDMIALLNSSNKAGGMFAEDVAGGIPKTALMPKLKEAQGKLKESEPYYEALKQYYLLNHAVLTGGDAQSRNEWLRSFPIGFTTSMGSVFTSHSEADAFSKDLWGSHQKYDDAAFQILQELSVPTYDQEFDAIMPTGGETFSHALGGLGSLAIQLMLAKRVISPVLIGSARGGAMLRASAYLKNYPKVRNTLAAGLKNGLLGGWYSQRVNSAGQFVAGLNRWEKGKVVLVESVLEEGAFMLGTMDTSHFGAGLGFGASLRLGGKLNQMLGTAWKPKKRYSDVFKRGVAPHLVQAAAGTAAMEIAEIGHSFYEISRYDDTFNEKWNELYPDWSTVGKRLAFNLALNGTMSFSHAYNPYSLHNIVGRNKTFNQETGEYGVSGAEFLRAKFKASFASRKQLYIDLINDFKTNPKYKGKGEETFAKEIAELEQSLKDVYEFELTQENLIFGNKLIKQDVKTADGKARALEDLKQAIEDAAVNRYKGWNLAIKKYVTEINKIHQHLNLKPIDSAKINEFIKQNRAQLKSLKGKDGKPLTEAEMSKKEYNRVVKQQHIRDFISNEMSKSELFRAQQLKRKGIVYHENVGKNYSYRVKYDKTTDTYEGYYVYTNPTTGRSNKVGDAKALKTVGESKNKELKKYTQFIIENAGKSKEDLSEIGNGTFTGNAQNAVSTQSDGILFDRLISSAKKHGLTNLYKGLSAAKKLKNIIGKDSPLQFNFVFHKNSGTLEQVIRERVAEKRRNTTYKFNDGKISEREFMKEISEIEYFAEKALQNSFTIGKNNTLHINVSKGARHNGDITETVAHEFAHPLLEYIKQVNLPAYRQLERLALNDKKFQKELEWASAEYMEVGLDTETGNVKALNKGKIFNETLAEWFGKQIARDQLTMKGTRPYIRALTNAYKKIVGTPISDMMHKSGMDMSELTLKDLDNPELIVKKINRSIRLQNNLNFVEQSGNSLRGAKSGNNESFRLIDGKEIYKVGAKHPYFKTIQEAHNLLRDGVGRDRIFEQTNVWIDGRTSELFYLEPVPGERDILDRVITSENALEVISSVGERSSYKFQGGQAIEKKVKGFEIAPWFKENNIKLLEKGHWSTYDSNLERAREIRDEWVQDLQIKATEFANWIRPQLKGLSRAEQVKLLSNHIKVFKTSDERTITHRGQEAARGQHFEPSTAEARPNALVDHALNNTRKLQLEYYLVTQKGEAFPISSLGTSQSHNGRAHISGAFIKDILNREAMFEEQIQFQDQRTPSETPTLSHVLHGIGLGKIMYETANTELQKTGHTLASDGSGSTSIHAQRVWESLRRRNLAKKLRNDKGFDNEVYATALDITGSIARNAYVNPVTLSKRVFEHFERKAIADRESKPLYPTPVERVRHGLEGITEYSSATLVEFANWVHQKLSTEKLPEYKDALKRLKNLQTEVNIFDEYTNESYAEWSMLEDAIKLELENIIKDNRVFETVKNSKSYGEFFRLSSPKDKEFAEWFKESAIRHPNGDPIMYLHGSKRERAFPYEGTRAFFTKVPEIANLYSGVFRQEGQTGIENAGDYFSGQNVSVTGTQYANPKPNTVPVYLNIKKPFDYKNIQHVVELGRAVDADPVLSEKLQRDNEFMHENKEDRGFKVPMRKWVYEALRMDMKADHTAGGEKGNWRILDVLKDKIKELGYDGYYEVERNPELMMWSDMHLEAGLGESYFKHASKEAQEARFNPPKMDSGKTLFRDNVQAAGELGMRYHTNQVENLVVFDRSQIRSAISPHISGESFRLAKPESKEFKEWFKGSKTQKEGVPEVWYRGSTGNKFREGMSWWTQNTETASGFAFQNAVNQSTGEMQFEKANVVPAYLNAKNPFDFRNKEHLDLLATSLRLDPNIFSKEGIPLTENNELFAQFKSYFRMEGLADPTTAKWLKNLMGDRFDGALVKAINESRETMFPLVKDAANESTHALRTALANIEKIPDVITLQDWKINAGDFVKRALEGKLPDLDGQMGNWMLLGPLTSRLKELGFDSHYESEGNWSSFEGQVTDKINTGDNYDINLAIYNRDQIRSAVSPQISGENFRITRSKDIKTYEDFMNYSKKFTPSYFIGGRGGSAIGKGRKSDPETAKDLQLITQILQDKDLGNVDRLEELKAQQEDLHRQLFQVFERSEQLPQGSIQSKNQIDNIRRKLIPLKFLDIHLEQNAGDWEALKDEVVALETYGRKALSEIRKEREAKNSANVQMALSILEGDGAKKGRKSVWKNWVGSSVMNKRSKMGSAYKMILGGTHNIYAIMEDLSINASKYNTFESPLVTFVMDNFKTAEKNYYRDRDEILNIVNDKRFGLYNIGKDATETQKLDKTREIEIDGKDEIDVVWTVEEGVDVRTESEPWTPNEAAKLYLETMDPTNFKGLETDGIMERILGLKAQYKTFSEFQKSNEYRELEIEFSYNPYFKTARKMSTEAAQRSATERLYLEAEKHQENVKKQWELWEQKYAEKYPVTVVKDGVLQEFVFTGGKAGDRTAQGVITEFDALDTHPQHKGKTGYWTVANRRGDHYTKLKEKIDKEKALEKETISEQMRSLEASIDSRFARALELIKNKAKEKYDSDEVGGWKLTNKGEAIVDLVHQRPELKQWADWIVDSFFPNYVNGEFTNAEGTKLERETLAEVFKRIYDYNLAASPKYSPVTRRVGGLDWEPSQIELLSSEGVFATATNKHFREKTANRMPLEKQDINQMLMRYINKMEHFKAYQEPLNDLTGVFNNAEVQKKINDDFHPLFNKEIQNHLVEIATKSQVQDIALEGIEKFRRKYIVGSLALKPSLFFKQLTSMFAYAADMPSAEWAKRTIIPGTKAWQEATETLMSLDFMKKRYSKMEIDEAIAGNMASSLEGVDTKFEQKRKKTVNFLMKPVLYGDKGAIIAGGWPLYTYTRDQALKAGKTVEEANAEAIKAFERTTALAQQASEASDLSRWQRDRTKKFLVMYKTSPMSYFRQTRAAIRALAAGKGDPANARKKIFIYHVLLPQLFQGTTTLFKWGIAAGTGDQDTKDKVAKGALRGQARAGLLGSFNGIALIGDMLSFGMTELVENTNYGYSLSAVAPNVEDVMRSGVGLARYIAEEAEKGELNEIDVWEALEYLDKFADPFITGQGIPYRGFKKGVLGTYGLYNRLQEQEVDDAWMQDSPTFQEPKTIKQ